MDTFSFYSYIVLAFFIPGFTLWNIVVSSKALSKKRSGEYIEVELKRQSFNWTKIPPYIVALYGLLFVLSIESIWMTFLVSFVSFMFLVELLYQLFIEKDLIIYNEEEIIQLGSIRSQINIDQLKFISMSSYDGVIILQGGKKQGGISIGHKRMSTIELNDIFEHIDKKIGLHNLGLNDTIRELLNLDNSRERDRQ